MLIINRQKISANGLGHNWDLNNAIH